MVEGDGLPNAIQAATIAGFGRVHDRGLLVPFVEPYFAGIEQVWADKTSEMAQNIVVGLYPTDLADDERVDVLGATDAWLDAHPDAPPPCAAWCSSPATASAARWPRRRRTAARLRLTAASGAGPSRRRRRRQPASASRGARSRTTGSATRRSAS